MTKTYGVLLLAVTTCSCWVLTSCEPHEGGPPSHAEWEMTFHDEFEGNGVNWDVWESSAGPRGKDHPEGRWPENNVVKDGILYQVTKRENPPRGGKEWSSAHIWTRTFTQKYGYFECRIRYGRYLNNAFWLFRPPGKRYPDPPHFEIDINEGHTPRDVAMTLHFYIYPEGEKVGDIYSTNKTWKAPMDLDRDFHVYACEWNEQEIIWYFDGQPVRRLKNPVCHAPADVRLSTVIMTRALEKDGIDIATMDGVSMAVDWVRVYRKKRDLHRPKLPELEAYKVPEVVKRDRQVAPAAKKTLLFKDGFESVAPGSLPNGWEIGDGQPAVAEDKPQGRKKPLAKDNKVLKLNPGDYVFRMLDTPVTDRMEVEFDTYTPWRKDGLLFVTLGDFRKDAPELRKTSYYTGDIGPYIHWTRHFISYYTEKDKWTPFAQWGRNRWGHFRFVLDIGKGVFDCYEGKNAPKFIGGGVFRHHQKAAKGIGLRHRGKSESVFVDNVTVRALAE
ncbi:MAG: glycoside hydrolase family 16 protein [Planctomycetes bacterium]|nr:glycoside hydrolase family 16 protein [Planctomycetota bacterium]